MESSTRKAVVTGRVARVELCACGGGLTLTIGPMSLRLDLAAAGDVAATIGQALAVAGKAEGGAPGPCRTVEEGGPN